MKRWCKKGEHRFTPPMKKDRTKFGKNVCEDCAKQNNVAALKIMQDNRRMI